MIKVHHLLRKRIDSKTDIDGRLGGCWKWTGYITNKGYPRVWDGVKRKETGARRIVYQIHYGHELKDNQQFIVRMTCVHKWCVNPEHMVLSASPSTGGQGKFDLMEIEAIRLLNMSAKYGHQEIARMFNVNYSTIYDILKGKTYKHIKAQQKKI